MTATACNGGSQRTRKTPAKRMISQRKLVFLRGWSRCRASVIDFAGFPVGNLRAIELLASFALIGAQGAGGAQG
jgi:hypothetical protein